MVKFVSESDFIKSYNNLIIPYITKRRTDGTFCGFNQAEIFYSIFKADKERGKVILLHGYTEGIEKYRELIYYFLQDGLSVYVYDQRSHGKSHHPVSDVTLVHVDSFDEYVYDLEYFIDNVVSNVLPNKKGEVPLFIYAHSMGGAVATLYLEKGGTKIKKAVLNAPMIAHRRPSISHVIMLPLLSIVALFAPKKRIFTMPKYPGYENFEDYSGTSAQRFWAYENYKRENIIYAGWAPTHAWARESFKVPFKILKKGAVEKINVPVYVYSAELDKVVKNSYHLKFVRRLKYGVYKIIKNAKHEIFNSTNDVLESYITEVLNVLK